VRAGCDILARHPFASSKYHLASLPEHHHRDCAGGIPRLTPEDVRACQEFGRHITCSRIDPPRTGLTIHELVSQLTWRVLGLRHPISAGELRTRSSPASPRTAPPPSGRCSWSPGDSTSAARTTAPTRRSLRGRCLRLRLVVQPPLLGVELHRIVVPQQHRSAGVVEAQHSTRRSSPDDPNVPDQRVVRTSEARDPGRTGPMRRWAMCRPSRRFPGLASPGCRRFAAGSTEGGFRQGSGGLPSALADPIPGGLSWPSLS
jgi:hypothetical protein